MLISLLLLFVMIFSVTATFAAEDNSDAIALNDEILEDGIVSDVSDTADIANVNDESNLKEVPVVNQDNFYDYFDDSGTLTSDADELVFEGNFSGVNYISIEKSVKLTGRNAKFNGTTFSIMANDVTIDGFTLIQNSDYLFTIYGDNVILSNNNIDFKTIEGADSYAIYAGANWAGVVNNLKI